MLSYQAPQAWQDEVLALNPVSFAPHPVHKVPTLFFQIVRLDSGQPVGEINLRLGSNSHIERYAGHIGYTIDPAHRGHRYAAPAVRLLDSPRSGACDQSAMAHLRSGQHRVTALLRIRGSTVRRNRRRS